MATLVKQQALHSDENSYFSKNSDSLDFRMHTPLISKKPKLTTESFSRQLQVEVQIPREFE